MAVYVDDMRVRARVGSIDARWSHLTADSEPELHTFAARLGLRRSWFQQPRGLGGKPVVPHSLKAQMWHYDVTDSKRSEAIRLGAQPISMREGVQIMRARHARLFPEESARITRASTAAPAINPA
jgi:hypothetical protein